MTIISKRKQVESAHEWWIDILSFLSLVGIIIMLLPLTRYIPSQFGLPVIIIILIAYVYLQKKIKKTITDKIEHRKWKKEQKQ